MRYRPTLGWGARDASRFTESAQEADRFISAFAENRQMPSVRMLKARATLLTGDYADAGAQYRSVFDEWEGLGVEVGGVEGFDGFALMDDASCWGAIYTFEEDGAVGE